MCTGRLDPALIAKGFRKGLDGMLVVGCYFGDCHYISGNFQAKSKIEMTRRLFKHIGVHEDRLAFRQCSSGEASVFVRLVGDFSQSIRSLGPLGQGADRLHGPELLQKINIAEAVLAGEKIRWVIGKRTPFLQSGNMYGEVFTEHEFNRAIDMIIVEETEVQEILAGLREGAKSVKDLAKALSIPAQRVFRYMTALRRKNMVAIGPLVGQSPIYRLIPQEV